MAVKLATIPVPGPASETERREGRLVVLSPDGATFAIVPKDVAANLREALESWSRVEADLRDLAMRLAEGKAGKTFPVDGQRFLAPLPRTTSWLDGSSYIQHIVLVRKARGAEPPEDLTTVPLMYQGSGDPIRGATDPIQAGEEAWGIDFEAEVAVVLDDTPMGTSAKEALQHVRLLVLMNDVSLRNLIPRELAAGFGFFHGKPATHLAPFAVTPDELGSAWANGRLSATMHTKRNGKRVGELDVADMHFSFGDLIAHAAKTRHLPAGTILGAGTVSNKDTAKGCACLAEVRMLETIATGKASTPFLSFGERVTIDCVDKAGRSLFGVIDHVVERYVGPS